MSVADAAVSDREERILGIIETARGKRAKFRDEHVTMAHGAGGKATQGMIEGLFVPAFASPGLDSMGDAGLFAVDGLELALTTDAFVVRPLFFPGGDIGRLAVCGTVNDLVVGGARPLDLSVAFILEEGLAISDLRRIVASMKKAADEAEIRIVAGDTKVVDRGKGDGVYIATTGVGAVAPERVLPPPTQGPATRFSSPARWATTAWRLWRSAKASNWRRRSPATSLRLVASWRRSSARAHASARCAIRPAAASPRRFTGSRPRPEMAPTR